MEAVAIVALALILVPPICTSQANPQSNLGKGYSQSGHTKKVLAPIMALQLMTWLSKKGRSTFLKWALYVKPS